jgi:hypothetical protein
MLNKIPTASKRPSNRGGIPINNPGQPAFPDRK